MLQASHIVSFTCHHQLLVVHKFGVTRIELSMRPLLNFCKIHIVGHATNSNIFWTRIHCIHHSILTIKELFYWNFKYTCSKESISKDIQVLHGTCMKKIHSSQRNIRISCVWFLWWCIAYLQVRANPYVTMWHMEHKYLCINYTRLASCGMTSIHVLRGNSWQIKPHPYLILMCLN